MKIAIRMVITLFVLFFPSMMATDSYGASFSAIVKSVEVISEVGKGFDIMGKAGKTMQVMYTVGTVGNAMDKLSTDNRLQEDYLRSSPTVSIEYCRLHPDDPRCKPKVTSITLHFNPAVIIGPIKLRDAHERLHNLEREPTENTKQLFIKKVKGIQITLAYLESIPIQIDGNVRKNTRRAIKAYQNDKNLTVTGQLDKKTLDLLAVERQNIMNAKF